MPNLNKVLPHDGLHETREGLKGSDHMPRELDSLRLENEYQLTN